MGEHMVHSGQLSRPCRDHRHHLHSIRTWLSLASIAFVLSTAVAASATAATYYVDANGHDSSLGTADAPWATVRKAIASLQPGDTVLVRGGVYRESITININGTADRRVTIQAYPDETPVLEGTRAISGWTQCTANEPGLSVLGVGNPHYANIYRAQVTADSLDLKNVMILESGELLRMARFPDQSGTVFDKVSEYASLSDSRNWAQRNYLWDPARLNQPSDYWNGAMIRIWSHAANNVVLDNTIADFDQSEGRITFEAALSADLINTGSLPDAYSIVNHPHIVDQPGEYYINPVPTNGQYTVYLWPRATDHLEQSVAISVSGAGVYFVAGCGNYVTIDGFDIRGFAGDKARSTGGIICSQATAHAGTVIRNCRIYNNRGKAGIWIHTGNGDVIENNKIYNIQGGFGILFSGTVGGLVRANQTTNTASTGIYTPGCSKTQVVGNRVGGGGVHANGISVYQNAKDVLVAHNVVTDASHAFTFSTSSNLTVFNNIFHGSASSVVADWGGCSGTVAILNNAILGGPDVRSGLAISSGPTYIVKNNFLAGGGGGIRSHNIYTALNWNQTSRAGWSLAEGESVCKTLSTLFVDPANHDYRLADGSPAINAGTVIDAYLPKDIFPEFDFNLDIAGTARDAVPDIGPYEYGSGGPVNAAYDSGDPVNRAPVLESVDNHLVTINEPLSFSVTANDPDGDPVALSVSGLPSGAVFSNQEFTWTPTSDQLGSYQVTFTASDGTAQDSETITILVQKPNTAPILAAIGNQSVNENEPLSFSINATDADGDAVTYSLTNAPSGASLTGQTFSWTPSYSQAGSYDVTFVASDGRAQDSRTVTISVANINRPPVLAAVGDRSVDATNLLSFTLSAADPDGDDLVYSAAGLASSANLAGQTFSWTPGPGEAGSYEFTFTVSDGELTDSETIAVMVAKLGADETAPVVARCSPVPDAIQVPLNNLVTVHLTDAGTGVNAESVTIAVDNAIVYQGNEDSYTSAYGQCNRSGTKNDYEFVYQHHDMFEFDHTVNVTINAADLAGNAMDEFTYSFVTEMRVFGSNQQVSKSTGTLDESGPGTASDAAGNLWAVWHAGPENSRDIYAAKLPAGEDAFGAPIRLTTDSDDQCNPDVAVGADGSVYVVWQDNRQGHWDILASVCSDGERFSREVRVTDSKDNEIYPAIAADHQSPGSVYVAWQDDRNGNQDIYATSSVNAFAAANTSQVTGDLADQLRPDITVDGQNRVYIVWTDMRAGQADLYGAASGSGGWTEVPFVVGAGDQTDPAVAAEPDSSTLHLLWVDNLSGDNDIRYARSDGLPGNPLAGVSIVDDTSGADQTAPSVACSGNQSVFACWQDARHVGVYGTDTDLYFADLSSGTASTNVLVRDDGTGANQSEPAVGVDRYGHPYVVWTDDRDQTTEIYYAATTFIDPVPLDSKIVVASEGAVIGADPTAIRAPEDVSIVVPPGACRTNVRIMISRILNPQISPLDCLGSYDFGPSGIDFDQPVTVTIPYRFSGRGGRHARPYWYDSLTGALSQQGIAEVENLVLSSNLNALRFQTAHFTPFYVVGGDSDIGSSDGIGAGGCSISPTGNGSPGQLLAPYTIVAVVMTILRRRDRKKALKSTGA